MESRGEWKQEASSRKSMSEATDDELTEDDDVTAYSNTTNNRVTVKGYTTFASFNEEVAPKLVWRSILRKS
ncbi:hypothetical protein Gorai_014664, partial [Gossypium raimondii]|nr:hypothetical protein [Gossypium raimondii]